MKRVFLAFALLISFYNAKSNHILGGEITWECSGNQAYIFQLVLYGDCSDLPISGSSHSLQWNGGAPIVCTFVDSSIISPTCGNGAFAISCDSTAFFTPIKRYVYRSAPLFLNGTMPSSGWNFSIQIQARPVTDNTIGGSTNGYLLRATMYPYTKNGAIQSPNMCYDNAPKFEEKPRYAFGNDTNFYHLDGYDIDSQDSIFFNWAPALNYGTAFPGTTLGYAVGYGYNQPLPGPGINAGNSGATLLGSGLLLFKSTTVGRFTTCYTIESWRDGQKIAEVFRDFEMQVNIDPGSPGLCSSSNNPPSVTTDWVAGFDTLQPVYDNGKIVYYETTVFAGETVKFKLFGQDFDLRPNCSSQQIAADAIGASMSISLLGTIDCDGPPCAQLVSLNSGGSYTAPLNNQTRFEWVTDTSHAYGPKGYGVHTFNFTFTDDHCVLPGVGQQQVRVKVLRPIYTTKSTYKICQGDTVQAQMLGDVSNLSWSPAVFISCTNCANPLLYPMVTTNYAVTDLNSGYTTKITVEVDAAAPMPLLSQNGNNLQLGNATSYDTLIWSRNNGPFYPQPNNSYTPWLSGDYWVQGASGACTASSDTFSYSFPNNLQGTSTAGGELSNIETLDKTYGVTIRLNNEAFYALDGFYLHAFDKNLQGANLTTISCAVYNQQQAKIFQSDSVTRVSNDILKFHGELNLSTQEDYLLTFYTDTSIFVPTFEPISWPVVASAGRVFVFNATKSLGNFYPATSATDYPFFHLSLKWGIGLAEEAIQNVRFYPNPAQDVLHIESARTAQYTITNAIGQTLASGSVDAEKTLDISTWQSGFYIINFRFENGASRSEKLEILR